MATFVAEAALDEPRGRIVEIAGPERAPFNDIVARYLKAVGDPRQVIADRRAPYWGARVRSDRSFPSAKRVSAASRLTIGSALT